mmetsp:Transcript_16156/g.38988  ORF Transcript_16156/g.38988 Transcript_16156/m.38988 type:complete len:240 (-) Transcript_16156:190-909(-)
MCCPHLQQLAWTLWKWVGACEASSISASSSGTAAGRSCANINFSRMCVFPSSSASLAWSSFPRQAAREASSSFPIPAASSASSASALPIGVDTSSGSSAGAFSFDAAGKGGGIAGSRAGATGGGAVARGGWGEEAIGESPEPWERRDAGRRVAKPEAAGARMMKTSSLSVSCEESAASGFSFFFLEFRIWTESTCSATASSPKRSRYCAMNRSTRSRSVSPSPALRAAVWLGSSSSKCT